LIVGGHSVAHRVRRQRPADAQSRGERLRERPEVDDVLLVHRAQRGVDLPVETEQPVRVVFDDEDARFGADVDDLGASFDRERHAGRVVEVRDRVEELDAFARTPTRVDRVPEPLWPQPVVVHGHVHDLRLIGRERTERADVGGPLGEHHVTRIAEEPGGHVQRHLGTDRDHDVVGMCPHALQRHDLADLFA
jgi:hypothetical protein